MQYYEKTSHKYTLQEDVSFNIGIKPPMDIVTPSITLLHGGTLTIRKGYQWNGPKCRGFWCKHTVRGALLHDALYQLMNEHHIPTVCKDVADRTLMIQCIDDGTPAIVARLLYSLAKRAKVSPVNKNTFHSRGNTSIRQENC